MRGGGEDVREEERMWGRRRGCEGGGEDVRRGREDEEGK